TVFSRTSCTAQVPNSVQQRISCLLASGPVIDLVRSVPVGAREPAAKHTGSSFSPLHMSAYRFAGLGAVTIVAEIEVAFPWSDPQLSTRPSRRAEYEEEFWLVTTAIMFIVLHLDHRSSLLL